MPDQLMDLAAGVKVSLIALMLNTDKCCFGGSLIARAVRNFNVTDEVCGARHRCEHQRPRVEQPSHADGENGVILVDYRGDGLGITLAWLAGHPVDALRLVEGQPRFKVSRIQKLCFAKQKQFDLALSFIR